MNNIFNMLIEVAKKESESIRETIIESITPTSDEHGYWQVGDTITEIIQNTNYDLVDKGMLEDDELIDDYIIRMGKDIRYEVFKILTDPIAEYFDGEGYLVEVDYFWEEVRVYEVEEN